MLDILNTIIQWALAFFPLAMILLFLKSKRVAESKFGKSDYALILVYVAAIGGVICLNN